MHKWNVFRRTAPFVLSVAVAASGMPVTALAEEAFVDEVSVEETADLSGEMSAADEGASEEYAAEEYVPEEYEAAENVLPEEEAFGDGVEEGFYTEEEAWDESAVFTGDAAADAAEPETAAPATEGTAEAAGKTYKWKK